MLHGHILTRLSLLLPLFLSACGDSNPTTIPEKWTWPQNTPASKGLNEGLLSTMTTELSTGELGPVSSILIVRDGVLVYEEYFRGKNSYDLHGVQSVSKSVASALVGIAWDRGLIQDLQTPVLDFFPEYTSVENEGEWKRAMTLEHVLQMRTGIDWDEWDAEKNTWGEQGSLLWESQDWIKFVLDQPMAAEPGSVWLYNTGATTLLSGVLKNTTGMAASAFAEGALFEPLQIDNVDWWESSNGLTSTGTGLYLRPRDLAKLGYLFLERGVWRPTNEPLISQEWVDASFHRYTTFGGEGGGGYGYQWRVCVAGYRGQNIHIPFAQGYGGQYLFVVDPLDLVIVVTGEHYHGEKNHINHLLYDFLLPAADPEAGRYIYPPPTAGGQAWLPNPENTEGGGVILP